MSEETLTKADKQDILDAVHKAKISVLRGQHTEDKAMKLLEEVLSAYRGIGDLPGALMKASVYLERTGNIKYNEEWLTIEAKVYWSVLEALSDVGKTPADEWYEIMSYARILFDHKRGRSDMLVKGPHWLWASLLWGPAAHIGLLPDQPYYGIMSRARKILQHGGEAEALELAERLGLEAEDLEDLVASMMGQDESSINNGGVSSQVEYLYSVMGPDLIPELEKTKKG